MPRIELRAQARAIPKSERGQFLQSMRETEMHQHLEKLFSTMEPDYRVAVTHGVDELGKDLVLVREDKVSRDVIGVIVKRGDIKGETLGDVDAIKAAASELLNKGERRRLKEIQSQIAQAMEHPAEITTSFAALPVNKVIVILVGAASKRAKERLRLERPSAVDVHDIDWLIAQFTDHYPQVFFRGATVDYLQEQLARLEANHFLAKAGRQLSEYYVEPLVAHRALPLGAGEEEELAIAVRERRLGISSLRRLLDTKARVLLVGDPGSGKSTAVAKIAIDLLSQQTRQLVASPSEARITVPLMVRASELIAAGTADTLLAATLPPEIVDQVAISVIMVDGLDEIHGPDRQGVLLTAHKMAVSLDCALVVTSRKVGAVATTPDGYERYELMPFEINQAMKLVAHVLKKKSALPALKEGIKRLAHQLPMNPLSLVLLVEIVEERQEVPASLVELYDRFTDMALGRFDREKGIAVVFEYVIKKRFLARLAHDLFYSRGSLSVSRTDFDAFVDVYAAEYGWDRDVLGDFVKEIERAGILELGEEIAFRHRSFLEYFLASHIFDNRVELGSVLDLVTEMYFNEIWSDVAFYFVGLAREMPRPLLDRIVKHTPKDGTGSYEKLLLGRLLQAGWYSPTKTKRDGIIAAITNRAEVSEHVFGFTTKANLPAPRTLSDFITLMLCDLSFGSMVLQKESREALEELLKGDSADPLSAVALYGALERQLSDSEREDVARRVQLALKLLPPADEARGVLMMLIASRGSPELAKALNRRLRTLRQQAPKEVKALLPPTAKRIRGKKTKRRRKRG